MAFNYRFGKTKPVEVAVESATVISIGDLVYLDTDDAKPASDQADQGTEAANQELFHVNFLGVAMDRSDAGDTKTIKVATEGVFEFSSASATFQPGAMVGAAEAASGTALEDQTVVAVAQSYLAVGRIERLLTADTSHAVKSHSQLSSRSPPVEKLWQPTQVNAEDDINLSDPSNHKRHPESGQESSTSHRHGAGGEMRQLFFPRPLAVKHGSFGV